MYKVILLIALFSSELLLYHDGIVNLMHNDVTNLAARKEFWSQYNISELLRHLLLGQKPLRASGLVMSLGI